MSRQADGRRSAAEPDRRAGGSIRLLAGGERQRAGGWQADARIRRAVSAGAQRPR